MLDMRCRTLTIVALVFVTAGNGAAQTGRDKVSFRNVRIGFPPGPHTATPDEAMLGQRPPMYKAGAWTPIIVDVQNTGRYDPATDGPAIVSVDVSDSDDTLNSYSAPLPQFDEGGSASVILYTRPGSHYADITVRIQAKGRDLCKPDQRNYSGLDANQLLYLALGSRMPGLKMPGSSQNQQPTQNQSRSEIGLITRVVELPTLWFGYGSADVVILATSDRDFISAIVSDQSGRRRPWRNGSAAGASSLSAPAGTAINSPASGTRRLAANVDRRAIRRLGSHVEMDRWQRRRRGVAAHERGQQADRVHQVGHRSDRATHVLMEGPTPSPLVVQGPYGLGRVTLVAFDPDLRPMRDWKGEANFWEQLLRGSGPGLASTQMNPLGGFGGRYGGDQVDEALQSYVNRLDQFEGKGGRLVVLPTDTVYGIGADAFDNTAVAALLSAKGRGRDMPVPVLVGSWHTIEGLVYTVPNAARELIRAFWPGALSLVVQQAPSLQWDLGDAAAP